MASLTSI